MQIFAFTECPEFQALLEIEIKEITGERPVVRTTIEELESLLGILESIDLLIIDLPDDMVKSKRLKSFLVISKGVIKKTLILGQEIVVDETCLNFPRSDVSKLFENIKSMVKPKVAIKDEWTAVPLCTLIHFKNLPFDLYLKLSNDRFVKRIPAFEEVDKEVIDSLNNKAVTDLYCEKKHNRDFSMTLINNMINKIDRNYSSTSEKLKANEEVFQTTKAIVQNLGLSGRVIEVCETSIEKMCLDVLAVPSEFSSFLLEMKQDKSLAFHYKLITLTNYIGVQLIMEMKLPNPDEEVKKFVFASYFCDMTLKNPGFIHLRRPEDSGALSLQDQNDVNFHAFNAYELVQTSKETPEDCDIIIQQHHGSFNGIGFPAEKSAELLPLSKILIVSQDLAFAILSAEETPALETFKRFLKLNRCGGLQELLKYLENSISKAA